MKATKNYEGGLAFEMDPATELYTRVSTCLVNEPKFYGKRNDEMKRILELINIIADQEPQFLTQLAAYTRNKMYMRSIPIVLLGEASMHPKARAHVKTFTPAIIKRADELSEIIGYIGKKLGGNIGNEKGKDVHGMLPNALRKGLADAMLNFNEYQYSKYDRNNAEISMLDVIRLVHPKGRTEKEMRVFEKIAKQNLSTAQTWETETMKKGSTKETWEDISKKMGIMAILRNLRNFLDKEVSDETIDHVIAQLEDEQKILNSKQFPFRFLSAYRAIQNNNNRKTGKLLTALDRAIGISIKNLPLLDGVTAVFCDNSGSMHGRTISGKSDIKLQDIGGLFGGIASIIAPDNIVGAFADQFATINFSQRESALARAEKIRNTDVGGGTYSHLTIDYLIEHNIKVHRIFIFSDEQGYDRSGYNDSSLYDSWERYKRNVNHSTYLYSFDLTGYGTTQIPTEDPHVLKIAGWSENILKYIPQFEGDRKTVLAEIRNIKADTYKKNSEEKGNEDQ